MDQSRLKPGLRVVRCRYFGSRHGSDPAVSTRRLPRHDRGVPFAGLACLRRIRMDGFCGTCSGTPRCDTGHHHGPALHHDLVPGEGGGRATRLRDETGQLDVLTAAQCPGPSIGAVTVTRLMQRQQPRKGAWQAFQGAGIDRLNRFRAHPVAP